MNGRLAVTNTVTTADVTVAGAQGNNTVTFADTALKAAFVGQGGDDTVAFGTIKAGSTVTAVTGAGKDSVTVDATALVAGAGAVSIETGAGDDTVTLTAATATTGTIVVQFGDGNDTLKIGAASDLSKANLTVTGMEKLDIAAFDATVSASQFSSLGSFELVGTAALTVDGSAGTTAQTIDASKVTLSFGTTSTLSLTGGSGNDTINGTISADTITGGAGADVLTGGAGADVFNYTSLTTVADQTGITLATADLITDFSGKTTDGTSVGQLDTLKLGTAGTAANYAEAAQVADFAAALAAANAAFAAAGGVDSTLNYYLTSTAADGGLLFINATANDGAADAVIKLAGITSANFEFGDIVA